MNTYRRTHQHLRTLAQSKPLAIVCRERIHWHGDAYSLPQAPQQRAALQVLTTRNYVGDPLQLSQPRQCNTDVHKVFHRAILTFIKMAPRPQLP